MRSWTWRAAALCLVVAGGAYLFLNARANNRQAYATQIAVTKLPAGTEKAWLDYVDRRIAMTLRRDATGVRVLSDLDGFLGKKTDVPFDTPYEIVCTKSFGGLVRFGKDTNAITMSVFGPTDDSARAEASPPLGVDSQSVAALNLQKELCHRVSTAVRTAMGR